MKKSSAGNRNLIYKIQVTLTEEEYGKFQEDYAVWNPADSGNKKLKSESNYFRFRYMNCEPLQRAAPRGNLNAKKGESDSEVLTESNNLLSEKKNNLISLPNSAEVVSNDEKPTFHMTLASDPLKENLIGVKNQEDLGVQEGSEKNFFVSVSDEDFDSVLESLDAMSDHRSLTKSKNGIEFVSKKDSPPEAFCENLAESSVTSIQNESSNIYEPDVDVIRTENTLPEKAPFRVKSLVLVQPSLFETEN